MEITKNVSTWYTQQQLADKLNISVQRVHNWVKRGKIDTKELPPSNILLVNPFTIKIKKYNNFV